MCLHLHGMVVGKKFAVQGFLADEASKYPPRQQHSRYFPKSTFSKAVVMVTQNKRLKAKERNSREVLQWQILNIEVL